MNGLHYYLLFFEPNWVLPKKVKRVIIGLNRNAYMNQNLNKLRDCPLRDILSLNCTNIWTKGAQKSQELATTLGRLWFKQTNDVIEFVITFNRLSNK